MLKYELFQIDIELQKLIYSIKLAKKTIKALMALNYRQKKAPENSKGFNIYNDLFIIIFFYQLLSLVLSIDKIVFLSY